MLARLISELACDFCFHKNSAAANLQKLLHVRPETSQIFSQGHDLKMSSVLHMTFDLDLATDLNTKGWDTRVGCLPANTVVLMISISSLKSLYKLGPDVQENWQVVLLVLISFSSSVTAHNI